MLVVIRRRLMVVGRPHRGRGSAWHDGAMSDLRADSRPDRDLDLVLFGATGFTGGLNWYRCMNRNWELTPQLAGAHVTAPSFFLAGGDDNWDENTGLQTADTKPVFLGEATGLRQIQAPGATHGSESSGRRRPIGAGKRSMRCASSIWIKDSALSSFGSPASKMPATVKLRLRGSFTRLVSTVP